MIVRAATESDVPAVCDFVMQLAEYEKLANEVHFTQEQYSTHLFTHPPAPHPSVLIAESDAGPIGIALYIPILRSTVHLEDLFVSPTARGLGAGIALLSSLAQAAISLNASELEWACLDWNKPSLDFYASLGAVPITNRILYRITGDALAGHTARAHSFSSHHHIAVLDAIPSELDQNLKGIELVDTESGNVLASLYYTLSFTTFLATPVILVTAIVTETPLETAKELIDHLVLEARRLGYARIDIRINKQAEMDLASLLVSRFGAVEMVGWIPFSLRGPALHALANRVSQQSTQAVND